MKIRADYQRHEHLITDWLYGLTAQKDILTIARPIKVGLDAYIGESEYFGPLYETLTRRKQWGLAPYVGDPFIYVWYIAVNGDGEVIAQTGSWRHYQL